MSQPSPGTSNAAPGAGGVDLPGTPTPRWRISDVIDFEFFLAEDRPTDPVILQKRDHGIFLEVLGRYAGRSPGDLVASRSRMFWHWLQARRTAVGDQVVLPGRMFHDASRLLWKALGIAGFFLGSGVAAGLLHYEGTQPVNVTVYFASLVLLQILLVTLATGVIVLRKAKVLSAETTWWVGILQTLWTWLVVRFHRHVSSRLPGEQRIRMEGFLGGFRWHRALYGRVLLWPMVSLLQWFGVVFNLGALVTTLFLVTVSDRAFGWQSAVQFEPEQIHAVVQIAARPWSWWFPEGTGWPTLEEVRGSQIVLKDGIKSLATEDLVSWWPFLCLAVALYGFCPRLALLAVSLLWGRRALSRLSFSHVPCDRLCERMSSGVLETAGRGEPVGSADLAEEEYEAGVERASDPRCRLPARSAVVVLEPEIYETVGQDRLQRALGAKLPWVPALFLPIHEDPDAGETFWNQLGALEWGDQQPLVIVVQEAWQPPIAENLGFLKRLRKVLGAQAKVAVVLIGKPEGGALLTAVKEEQGRVWEQRLVGMGDAQLRLERLVDHE